MMNEKQQQVDVILYARTFKERMYALFSLSVLGWMVAITGRGAAMFRSGDDAAIQIKEVDQ